MTIRILGVIFFTVLSVRTAFAYEVNTHEVLSRLALSRSALKTNHEILSNFGLKSLSENETLPYTKGGSLTIQRLMELGSRDEDDKPRPIHHFFDPYLDRALTSVPLAQKSPDWILEDQGQKFFQDFSYRDANGYLRLALTSETKEEQQENWGLLFESLGHVIHHVQDMAQPQHVRNDPHYVSRFSSVNSLVGDVSLHENCTEAAIVNPASLLGCGTPLAVSTYPRVALRKARDFWTAEPSRYGVIGRGVGLADFTNNNFISKDTNFQLRNGKPVVNQQSPYNLPLPTTSHTRTLQDLGAPNAADICGRLKNNPKAASTPNAKCEIEFYATDVYDAYTRTSSTNELASSLSIFDQYLHLREGDDGYETDRLFTLNRFNYAAAHPYLIPLAIAYSAGLIDHFFRGRLEAVETVVMDGVLEVTIKNVSEADNSFSDGKFSLYYDAADEKRYLLPITTGEDLSSPLEPGAEHTVTASFPEDIDLLKPKQLVLMYEGQIGEEEGVTGLVMEAPVSGFVFNPSVTSSDGVRGSRLITYGSGGWKLHPQAGFQAGNIDWRGRYRNGIPTRSLSWSGPDTRYFSGHYLDPYTGFVTNYFGTGIYKNGKRYASAPSRVMGAAITTDDDGKEWLIAITPGPGDNGDRIYKRPNTYNLSSATFNAVTAPEGWQSIATFPALLDTLPPDRAWFFNGDGTEAQTMRKMKDNRLIRLKISVQGNSAALANLGESTIKAVNKVDIERKNCEWYGSGNSIPDTPELQASSEVTISGEAIIAVDYIDSQEVLGRLSVEQRSLGTATGFQNNDGMGQSSTYTSSARSILRLGANETEISRLAEDRNSQAVTYQGVTSTHTLQYHSAAIFFLDLRSDSLLLRDNHRSDNYNFQAPANADTGTYHSVIDYRTTLDLMSGGSQQNHYDGSAKDVKEGSGGTSVYYNGIADCFDEPGQNASIHETIESNYSLNFPSVEYSANTAIDGGGRIFSSLRFRDEKNKTRVFNYLDGGDPLSIIGSGGGEVTFFPLGGS